MVAPVCYAQTLQGSESCLLLLQQGAINWKTVQVTLLLIEYFADTGVNSYSLTVYKLVLQKGLAPSKPQGLSLHDVLFSIRSLEHKLVPIVGAAPSPEIL
jgi:hypothetical protein